MSGPPAPTTASANTSQVKTAYIIMRHDLQSNRDSRMRDHDDAIVCLDAVYESLLDANQDAQKYFIDQVCFPKRPTKRYPRLDQYDSKHEENRDSATSPYTATRSVGFGDVDEIMVEVKPLKFVTTRRRQPFQESPAVPPQIGQQVTGPSKRAAPPKSSAGPSLHAVPSKSSAEMAKRAAPSTVSREPAKKQRRDEGGDDDDEVVCLS